MKTNKEKQSSGQVFSELAQTINQIISIKETPMIKAILHKSYLPIQTVFFVIQRKKYSKKMMLQFLKIKPKKICATSKVCEACYGK